MFYRLSKIWLLWMPPRKHRNCRKFTRMKKSSMSTLNWDRIFSSWIRKSGTKISKFWRSKRRSASFKRRKSTTKMLRSSIRSFWREFSSWPRNVIIWKEIAVTKRDCHFLWKSLRKRNSLNNTKTLIKIQATLMMAMNKSSSYLNYLPKRIYSNKIQTPIPL